MSWKYAISLYDYETIPLIKIILEKNTKVEMVFLLSTKDRKPGDELVDLSRHFGIKIEGVPIYDINNFYEVYLMLEKICKNYGFPSWINIASGSGISCSANMYWSGWIGAGMFHENPVRILKSIRILGFFIDRRID